MKLKKAVRAANSMIKAVLDVGHILHIVLPCQLCSTA